jgi:hypothetical protein
MELKKEGFLKIIMDTDMIMCMVENMDQPTTKKRKPQKKNLDHKKS